MLRSLLLILFLSLSCATLADHAEPHYYELFETGNAYYKAGTYDSAKMAYAEIVNNGYSSAELYYNFGNSFFKTGNIPAAILYYERALNLEPANVDARHNLDIANSFIADNIEEMETLFILDWWNGLSQNFTPDYWAWFIIMFISILCAGLTLYFTSKQTSFKQIGFFSALAAIFLVIVGIIIAKSSVQMQSEPYAIVFAPSVNVKSEPDNKATVQFVIHEGLKVRVIDSEDEWSRISLADGNSGWIPDQSIEEI